MKTLIERRLKEVEVEIQKIRMSGQVLWHSMKVGKVKREKGLKKWQKSCKEQGRLVNEKVFLQDLLK